MLEVANFDVQAQSNGIINQCFIIIPPAHLIVCLCFELLL